MEIQGRFFPSLSLVTDEDKSYFWVTLARADTSAFGFAEAVITGDIVKISVKNIKSMTVELERVAKSLVPARFQFSSDYPSTLVFRKNGISIAEFHDISAKSGVITEVKPAE